MSFSALSQIEREEVIQEYNGVVRKTKITHVVQSRQLPDFFVSTDLTTVQGIYLDKDNFQKSIHDSVNEYVDCSKDKDFVFKVGDHVFLQSFGRGSGSGSGASEILDITNKGYILLESKNEYIHFRKLHQLVVRH